MLIKDVLLGKVPLVTYTKEGRIEHIVNEACITDLHNTYKELILKENELREKKKRLRAMVYSSFCHLFKFARYLGLVEFVRYEPMIFPPPQGHLYQIGKHNGVHVRISQRKIFKLTELGIQDERAWADLCGAYKEGWKLPQKIEYDEPMERPSKLPEEQITLEPKKPKRHRHVDLAPSEFPDEPPEEVFAEEPSVGEYMKMVTHIKTLQGIGIEKEEVKTAIQDLMKTMDPWIVFVLEAKGGAEKAKNLEQYWRYKKEGDDLYVLYDKIESEDLGAAVSMLGKLIRERGKFGPDPDSSPSYDIESESERVQDIEDKISNITLSIRQIIDNITGTINPDNKAASANKIIKIIDNIDPDIADNELISGLEGLKDAIDEYKSIEREGLTPEEYREQKESAYEEISSAAEELDVDEDALNEVFRE